MLKKEFIISVILLVFYVSICYFLTYNNMKLTTISTDNIPLSGKKPNEIPIARLIIKDYNIDQYIYDIDSRENNVERNVTLLQGSILPEKDNSIVFLAAHSGTSRVSYFTKLNKMKKSTNIYFYYNNKIYTYKIIDIEEQQKDGYIEINKDNKKQLILTTCSTKNKQKQLVIKSTLINEKKYHV